MGVWGDRTCPELKTLAHCHYCPTYTAAGVRLLERPARPDYLAAQTTQVATSHPQPAPARLFSAAIFRLGQEWFALPAAVLAQALSPVAHHTLPHRSNRTLLGVANVRGQLLLKVSLAPILGLSAGEAIDLDRAQASLQIYPRTLVIEKTTESGRTDTWAFDVDELYGIQPVPLSQLSAPCTHSPGTCTRHVLTLAEKQVSLLDDVRLFEALRQQAL